MKIIIPARGGSKRIQNKNMSLLNGKPLLYWTVRDALRLSNDVYVSSDSKEILCYAIAIGANAIERDPSLCQDDTKSIAVWQDFCITNSSEYTALMQCTTPYRNVEALLNEIPVFIENGWESGFSVHSHKGFVHKLSKNEFVRGGERVRTQELEHCYLVEDGGFYMAKTSELLKANDLFFGKPFIFTGGLPIDIDTYKDLEEARRYEDSL
jgi:CMP-N-acetylneuraminic acid synthetase